jgi:DeoR/GlpR family transcriptional regulator of sugar metabolism
VKTNYKILKFIDQKDQVTIQEFADKLNVFRQYIHRLINESEEDLSKVQAF